MDKLQHGLYTYFKTTEIIVVLYTGVNFMKKEMCIKCGQKRGRRYCLKFGGFICGDCCSTTQLNYTCPKSCSGFGKINIKDYNDKINALLEIGTGKKDSNPNEAIKIFDRVLALDGSNYRGYVEKGAAYEKLGQFDKSIECLEKAYSMNEEINIYLDMVSDHMKAGRYKKALEMVKGLKDRPENPRIYYLSGQCLYMLGQFEDAAENMKKAIGSSKISKEDMDMAYITLARSYLMLKDNDLSIKSAMSIGKGHDAEKNEVLESAYFAGGKMYELIKLIDSIETVGGLEKYMLLQCCLVLNKNNHGNIIKIIDDILSGGFYKNNSYREAWLISLKIKLLFKECNMKQAYEVFMENEEKILKYLPDISDCSEACSLIAFFVYSIDRGKALSLYNISSGFNVSGFLMDELYNAFTTMDISPYIIARCIQRSFELMKGGKSETFNRTSIAADLLFEAGDYSRAAVFYSRLFDKDKPNPLVMYRISVCLMHQAKYEDAEEILKKIISRTHFIPGVNPALIKCALETGKDWMEYYKTMEIEKLDFSSIYELAGSLSDAGHFDKAGYLYSFILVKFKDMDIYSRKMVYHNMVSVYRNLHEYKKALEILGQIPPEYQGQDVMVDFGCLYCDTGDMQRSLDIFENIPKGYHEEIIDYNTGILQMKLGNINEALKCFQKSVEDIKDMLKDKGPMHFSEYRDILCRVYRNSSLCYMQQGNIEYALLNCERALDAKGDARTGEIISFVQGAILHPEKASIKEDSASLMDDCAAVNESFVEDIKATLKSLLIKVYGDNDNVQTYEDPESKCIGDFIDNEIKIYQKNRASIERSESTFQRHIDNIMNIFEKKVIRVIDDKFPAPLENNASPSEVHEYCRHLVNFGKNLFNKLQYSNMPGYVYISLIPFYKAVKILSVNIISPYYKKNMDKLPLPENNEGFKQIGIYYHKSYDDIFYRIDFSYDVSCSKYLFEINCSPGLRDKYFNFKRHYMPWDKLHWMISGIKKKWDVVDDARACGLMLLFYSGYKDYLGIESSLEREDIIKLSGDLIQLDNERNFNIRSVLNGDYELDCNVQAENIRDLALRCIHGLLKINDIEI